MSYFSLDIGMSVEESPRTLFKALKNHDIV